MSRFEEKCLWPLRAEGYFVKIVEPVVGEVDQYLVECTLYVTDYEEGGAGTAYVLRVNMDDPLETPEGCCVACNSKRPKTVQHGSTTCPICLQPTLRWLIRPKRYHGVFQLVPNAPAKFRGVMHALPPRISPIHTDHMIQSISRALKGAYEHFGSMMAGGGLYIIREPITSSTKVKYSP